jgi:BA14K-like protein
MVARHSRRTLNAHHPEDGGVQRAPHQMPFRQAAVLDARDDFEHYESLMEAFSDRSPLEIQIPSRQSVRFVPVEMVMKKVISGICAASMAVGVFGSAVSPAMAAPIPAVKLEVANSGLQQVQYRRDHDRDRYDRRRFDRPRHERRVERPRFEHRGGWGYYNGHRGNREYRRGYRQHNGWWFPPAAFVAGAIIGGAIASQPPVAAPPVYAPVRLSAAHVNWCQNRWRSYRVTDNSYQPLSGPRLICASPYGG